ncbi:MAG: cupin domain-containing protein [Candidatus Methanogasteraceae archaeon]
MELEIRTLDETEGLQTPEGVMKPLVFGENLAAMHLLIPAGLEVPPHAHPGEGVLYCLSGELEVVSGGETVTISSGTAMLVPSGTEVGIKNQKDAAVNALLISSPPPVRSVDELEKLIARHKA